MAFPGIPLLVGIYVAHSVIRAHNIANTNVFRQPSKTQLIIQCCVHILNSTVCPIYYLTVWSMCNRRTGVIKLPLREVLLLPLPPETINLGMVQEEEGI